MNDNINLKSGLVVLCPAKLTQFRGASSISKFPEIAEFYEGAKRGMTPKDIGPASYILVPGLIALGLSSALGLMER